MNATTRDTLLRMAVTIASASLLAALAPPLNLHYLHWFAYLPMFWVLREERPRANALFGWLYGTVAIAVIFRWLVDTIVLFSNIPLPVALLILLAAGAAFGLPYIPLWSSVHPLRRRLGVGWVVALPAVQVLIEYACQYLLLFPYNHGVSQFRFPFTWQLVSVTGVLGLTWLVFFVNCCFAEAIYRHREQRPFPVAPVASAVIVWSLVVIFGAWRFNSLQPLIAKAPLYRVAQLQTGWTMPQIIRHLQSDPSIVFRQWMEKSQRVAKGTADLVIWPEGASLWSLQDERVASLFQTLARDGDFDVIVGSGARDDYPRRWTTNQLTLAGESLNRADIADRLQSTWHDDVRTQLVRQLVIAKMSAEDQTSDASIDATLDEADRWVATHGDEPDGRRLLRALAKHNRRNKVEVGFNTVFHVAPSGDIRRYDKLVPLPFGEYMPLQETAPWLVDWIEGPGNFKGGQRPVVFQGKQWRIATPICYEAILPDTTNRFDNPDILVTITQDAWFGDTAAPWQHAMLAAIRATELGVPMYRAAYTGVSMVVEPDGTIRDETQPFTEVDRVVSVQMLKVPTLYARFGNWFVAVCTIGLTGALSWAAWRGRREA